MRAFSIFLSIVFAHFSPAQARPFEDGRLVPIPPITVNMFQDVGLGNVVWEREFSFPGAGFVRFRLDDISDASSGNYRLVVRDVDYNVLARIDSTKLEGKSLYWCDLFYADYLLMQVEKTDSQLLSGLSFAMREFVVEGDGRIKLESHDGSPVWVDVYKTHSDEIWKLSRSVAKLSIPQGTRNRACSGFLIGPNRLITNQHCVENSAQCEAMVIIFGYEFDRRVVRQPGVQYRCAGLLGTPNQALDFTMLEVTQQHEVKLPRRIAVARYPLTFWEWDYAAQNGGMEGYCPDDEGWGRGRQPVINVSWEDTQSYLDWLTRTTGKQYRLLTEAEWEYCCRSGSDEAYCFGKNRNTLHKYAWFEENLDGKTYSVGGKEPNAWGLYDMHGNVLERVQDDWHRSYSDKPEELRENGHIPWILGGHGRHVVRGGFSSPANLRCAHRERGISGTRVSGCGFRVARELIL